MSIHKKNSSYSLQSIGKIASNLTHGIIPKKDYFLASILHDWNIIVGEKYASHISLRKISFPKGKNREGTLHLAVSTSSTALMVQHLQSLILDKVNQFLGYTAFHKIYFHQINTTLPFSTPKSEKKDHLPIEEEKMLNSLLEEMADGDLKEALRKFGQSLYLAKGNE